jgi:hypothetical protein
MAFCLQINLTSEQLFFPIRYFFCNYLAPLSPFFQNQNYILKSILTIFYFGILFLDLKIQIHNSLINILKILKSGGAK